MAPAARRGGVAGAGGGGAAARAWVAPAGPRGAWRARGAVWRARVEPVGARRARAAPAAEVAAAVAGRGGQGGTAGTGTGGTAGTGGGTAGAGGGAHAADAAFCAQQITQAASDFTRFRTTYTNPSSPPALGQGRHGAVRQRRGLDQGLSRGQLLAALRAHARPGLAHRRRELHDGARAARRADDTHDVGFLIYNSYGNGYRLTQSAAYRTVLLQAAASLASRYDADVGCTRSWDFGSWMFPVIIDNMMNLELLFRATMLGGEARFAQIGTTHAATTSTNHFRADSSSYHVVDYNPTTGAVIRKQTNQGVADESAWARGQAWGLYGFTMSYRETNDARFLDQATRIAEFYTKSPRMPADGVPYFDFDAPVRDDVPDYRDASAGAIAASGLFELAKYATGAAAESYRAFAIKAVRSLSSTAYRAATGTNSQFLLMHSVGNYPQNDEIDVAINYADYYYLEALGRCADLP